MNGKRVLKEKEKEIKKLIDKGWSYSKIAKKFGVSRHSIYVFCKHRGWESKFSNPLSIKKYSKNNSTLKIKNWKIALAYALFCMSISLMIFATAFSWKAYRDIDISLNIFKLQSEGHLPKNVVDVGLFTGEEYTALDLYNIGLMEFFISILLYTLAFILIFPFALNYLIYAEKEKEPGAKNYI